LRIYTIHWREADWLALKERDYYVNLQLAYKAWLLEASTCETEEAAAAVSCAMIPQSMLKLIELGEMGRTACEEAAAFAASMPGDALWRIYVESARVEAPLKRPGKFLCIGLNYREHALESGAEIPTTPVFFNKFSTSITGPNGVIEHTSNTTELDYEIELGIVIGRRAKNVPAAAAAEYLYGYTIVNDVSARDLQHSDGQWVKGKALDTYAPTGPCILTKDEVMRPEKLDLRLSVNGEVRQTSNTEDLIFGIDVLISYLSSLMTLEPGDIIATGTPGGIGRRLNPPRFLEPGDVVTAEIETIGRLENLVVGG